MIVEYTTGVFDLFHIGHLNLLRNAKGMCDKLIVGVTTDELISYKNKKAIITHNERMEIVRAIKYVDSVIPQENIDEFEMWKKLKFNIMFVGDDWFVNNKREELEKQFKEVGVRIVYLPYTKGTSSTLINQTLEKLRNDKFNIYRFFILKIIKDNGYQFLWILNQLIVIIKSFEEA